MTFTISFLFVAYRLSRLSSTDFIFRRKKNIMFVQYFCSDDVFHGFFFTFISASDLLPMFHSVAVERKALLVYAFSFNSKYSCSWIPIFQLFRIYYFIFSIRSYIRHNDAVSHLSCSIRRVMHIKIIIIIHTHRTQSNWKRSESNWQHKLFLFQ